METCTYNLQPKSCLVDIGILKHSLSCLQLVNIDKSSLQCYSVLSDILVKIELCIPLESESSVLSTCNAFVCLSPPSKLKFAVLFCSICKGLISFSAILF